MTDEFTMAPGTVTPLPTRPEHLRTATGPFDLHCWVLLGRAKRRKASVIRALTGLARENWTEVMRADGQSLLLWSAVEAINEVPRDRAAPEPDAWAAALAQDPGPIPGEHPVLPARRNLLIALGLDVGVPGREAEHYLSALAAWGATFESIVTLGEPTRPQFTYYGAPFADIRFDAEREILPTNAIAAQIRGLWGWR